MKILALITARGGSKRIPGKNIRPLGGKPLICWSIDVVKNISSISDTLVSTEDPVIARVAKEAGAYVPWLRPHELATDSANSVDVALHALDWYEINHGLVDGLLLLQPTSPFRDHEAINRGITLFLKHGYQTVVGVSEIREHPMWALKQDGDYLVPFLSEHGFGVRFQDLIKSYTVNGSFYLISPADLRKNRSFIGQRIIPLIASSEKEGIDIDTEWDWKVAEFCIGK